jgi:flavin reductase (DIM6/NTAB) family NADH-FMN oxidoreductase RutF
MVTPGDARRFREVLGHYPTGVALVSAVTEEGRPIGMVVGSFTSVSLDPPLVAYLPMVTSRSFEVMRRSPTFVVNVLAAQQEDLCRRFAAPGDDKWEHVGWRPSPSGAPVLDGAVAWIECSTDSITEAGDHYVVLGQVEHLEVQDPGSPLLFFQGGYGRFTTSSVVASPAPDLVAAIGLAERSRDHVEALVARTGITCELLARVGDDLVFVGSVTGSHALPARASLGTRIPLMAPLGEQFVCWAGPQEAERWLARSRVTDEEVAAGLRARLALARRRGWSLSGWEPDDESAVLETLHGCSDGGLTPVQERGLRSRIAGWCSLPVEGCEEDLQPDSVYAAHSLVVPIHGLRGKPALNLRLTNLLRPASGTELLSWIDAARRTARELAVHLADPGSRRGRSTVAAVATSGWG